jgi:hypothetical protein
MSFYMDAPTSYMQDLGSYAVYADVCVGSNGSGTDSPAYSLLNSVGDMNGDYITWDNDYSNGFDTGSVPFSFNATSSSGTSLSVNASPWTSLSSASFNTVQSVEIVAGVQIPGEAVWSNIAVTFLKDGVAQETVSIANGPHVDTRTTPNNPNREQVLYVSPSRTDCNQVRVGGVIRMDTSSGVIPGPSDIFCDVAIVPRS